MVDKTKSPHINDQRNMAVFRVADAASFLWQNMDDVYIIYDKRSGYSQALNEFAREILALIEEIGRAHV